MYMCPDVYLYVYICLSTDNLGLTLRHIDRLKVNTFRNNIQIRHYREDISTKNYRATSWRRKKRGARGAGRSQINAKRCYIFSILPTRFYGHKVVGVYCKNIF